MFRFVEKLSAKNRDPYGAPPVTAVFLGDSVTQGCFECYFDESGTVQTRFDADRSYPARFGEILNVLYPAAGVHVINSGVSGDSATGGVERFARDVAAFSPDLVVVSYGLNDSCLGPDGLSRYEAGLGELFDRTAALGAECVYLTENTMCYKVSCHLEDEPSRRLAKTFSRLQNDGTVHAYFEAGKRVAASRGVTVCDLHGVWETLEQNGVDTTELLANRFNHPVRIFHRYVAARLVETLFGVR